MDEIDPRTHQTRYGHHTERTELFPDYLVGEHLSAEQYAREAGKQAGFGITAIVVAAVILGICAAGYVGLSRAEAAYQQGERV